MFYYRRKLLLALIQRYGGSMPATGLQKSLFLLSQQQRARAFDFIPYLYGCFSLQANSDLNVLESQGFLRKNRVGTHTNWELISGADFIGQLKTEDAAALHYVYNTFGSFSSNDLIKYTYLNYPYWAINSTILDNLLSDQEKEMVMAHRESDTEKCLFTIGYEGKSLETYINHLILNNVRLLCDVRKNAYSQKWGFSKSLLKDACQKVSIEYVHIPQLGIESEDRRDLKTLSDYKELFDRYEKTTLKTNLGYLYAAAKLFPKNNRVALTCFEKEVSMCHRGVIANHLSDFKDLRGIKRKEL
jgi:hypothetical protein